MPKIFSNRLTYISICCVLSIIFILSSSIFETETINRFGTTYDIEKGIVLESDSSQLQEDPYIKNMYIGRQYVKVAILSGEFEGEVFEVENVMSRAYNINCKEGTKILLNVRQSRNQVEGVDIYGYNRQSSIYVLVGLFLALLLFIGRGKGFYSLFSLLFTLITVVFFMIPLIIKGYDPILLSVITALLTTTMAIFIIADVNMKSISAILGIMVGIIVSGVVSYLVGIYGNISGINIADSAEMISLTRETPIQVPELLFAGIIISSLGAIMDVGMSISSSVFEIKHANNRFTSKKLYESGMNIGRDIMGTMSNTLILAFTGSSIALVIIICLYDLSYIRLINLDVLGIEIIRGLSGSIGLILTVPATAFISSKLAKFEDKR